MASSGPSHTSQGHYSTKRKHQAANLRRLQRDLDPSSSIVKQQRHVHVLRTLCTDRLPNELILHILAMRATSVITGLALRAHDTLYKAAENLLGVEAPDSLVETMEKVILESVPILFDIRYCGETGAHFPNFLPIEKLRTIRTLVLSIDVQTHLGYPAQLLDFRASVDSLRTQLPNIHHLCIIGRLKWCSGVPSMRDRLAGKFKTRCYSFTYTYREALENMVRIVQTIGVGRRQYFCLCWEGKGAANKSTVVPNFNDKLVEIGQREAGDVLELAMEMRGEGIRSNVSV
ncbi:hypothetical protein LTS10_008429 [Elasticomyces elasticus]|nr:hypothetical protein LTS10_008429 [Elasticomyces elasticus]